MKKLVLTFTLLFCIAQNVFSQSGPGPLSQIQRGSIIAVKVQGDIGLISLSRTLTSVNGASLGCNRVWVSLNHHARRIAYMTALTAFTIKNAKVVVRAYDNDDRRYEACRLYDIFVPN